MIPRWTGSRSPHSRQYSWKGSYGVPQRGHSPPSESGAGGGGDCSSGGSGGTPTQSSQGSPDRSACWYIVCASSCPSPSSLAAGTAVPQFAQNWASAGRALPQLVHETTGSSPTGRPQLAQKCEPHSIGAPQ